MPVLSSRAAYSDLLQTYLAETVWESAVVDIKLRKQQLILVLRQCALQHAHHDSLR
jgi:hypothetical protein